jgi:hypothetical protein
MFDKKFNIISGDRMSGRTRFLLNLSKDLDNAGIKLFFLGCVNEFSYPKSSLSQFKDYRLLDTSNDYNNLKMIEVVKEITERDSYHFLVVDDIDYLSIECTNLISKINIRKVVTCLNDNCQKITDEDSDFYNINDKISLNIKNDDGVSTIGGIIKNIIREQKINKILK